MRLTSAFFATAAEAAQGKLYILGGGIDSVEVAGLPAGANLSLVVLMTADPEECNRPHVLQLAAEGPSGPVEFPAHGIPVVPQLHRFHPERPVAMNFIVNLPGLLLTAVGEYTFRVVVDGQEAGRASFDVILVPQEPPAQGPPPGAA
jgi:hypothetical protein